MSGTVHKEWRGLVAELKRRGYEVVPAGGHLKVMRDGKRVATLPGTPGDIKGGRGLKNSRAKLRRLGLLGESTINEPLRARARDGEAGNVTGSRLA